MRLMGLIKRRECWVPTGRGWLALGMAALLGIGGFVWQVHDFLAVTHPVRGDVLVVEGWVDDYALESAAEIFKSGDYRLLITTGVPLFKGQRLSEFGNMAEVAAASLGQIGVAPEDVIAVPAPEVIMNRTFQSAKALREWLIAHHPEIQSFDLLTLGTHARRSWFVFRKVFGEKFRIGIISEPSQLYEERSWWNYSEGLKSVVDELVSYAHIRLYLLLHPVEHAF